MWKQSWEAFYNFYEWWTTLQHFEMWSNILLIVFISYFTHKLILILYIFNSFIKYAYVSLPTAAINGEENNRVDKKKKPYTTARTMAPIPSSTNRLGCSCWSEANAVNRNRKLIVRIITFLHICNKENSSKIIAAIPARKTQKESAFLLNRAKDLFRWDTGAIITTWMLFLTSPMAFVVVPTHDFVFSKQTV